MVRPKLITVLCILFIGVIALGLIEMILDVIGTLMSVAHSVKLW